MTEDGKTEDREFPSQERAEPQILHVVPDIPHEVFDGTQRFHVDQTPLPNLEFQILEM